MRGLVLRVGSRRTPSFTRRIRAYFELLERELPPYVERQLLAIDALTEQGMPTRHHDPGRWPHHSRPHRQTCAAMLRFAVCSSTATPP